MKEITGQKTYRSLRSHIVGLFIAVVFCGIAFPLQVVFSSQVVTATPLAPPHQTKLGRDQLLTFTRSSHVARGKSALFPYTRSHQFLPTQSAILGTLVQGQRTRGSHANASSGTPVATTSRYVVKADIADPTLLLQDGCIHSYYGESGIIILDFGQPWQDGSGTNGTLLPGQSDPTTYFVNVSTIENVVEWFLWGYWQCATGQNIGIVLGIGTNNFSHYTNLGHGQAWAVMVNDVNSWIALENFSSKEEAVGASEMKLASNSAADTKDWTDSYTAAAQYPYLNYGDAQGCPQDDQTQNRPCSNGWMQSDVLYVSWDTRAAFPLPQIYATDSSQASQWQSLGYYSHNEQNPPSWGPMVIVSSFTRWGACNLPGQQCDSSSENTPDRAWNQLSTALNSNQTTAQSLAFPPVNITWNILGMKMPWDASRSDVTFNSGPHGGGSLNTACQPIKTDLLSGLDFGMPENTSVLAVADGTVVYANQNYDGQLRGVVIIQHANGLMTEYWHLNTVYTSLLNTQVTQGTVIGLSGWSPCSTCPDGKSRHLHLEFRTANTTTPPTPFSPTPYSAHGLTIDGYTAWSLFPDPENGNGYNYQGTLTCGTMQTMYSTYGDVTGDHGDNCSTFAVIAADSNRDTTWIAGNGQIVSSTNQQH